MNKKQLLSIGLLVSTLSFVSASELEQQVNIPNLVSNAVNWKQYFKGFPSTLKSAGVYTLNGIKATPSIVKNNPKTSAGVVAGLAVTAVAGYTLYNKLGSGSKANATVSNPNATVSNTNATVDLETKFSIYFAGNGNDLVIRTAFEDLNSADKKAVCKANVNHRSYGAQVKTLLETL